MEYFISFITRKSLIASVDCIAINSINEYRFINIGGIGGKIAKYNPKIIVLLFFKFYEKIKSMESMKKSSYFAYFLF